MNLISSRSLSKLLFSLILFFAITNTSARAVDWVPINPDNVFTIVHGELGTLTCAPIKNANVSGRLVAATRFLPLSVSVAKLKKKIKKAPARKLKGLKRKLSTLKKRVKNENAACAAGPQNPATPTPTPPPSSDAVDMSKLDRAVTAEDVRLLAEKAGWGMSARESWLVDVGTAGGIDALVDAFMATRAEDAGLAERVEDMTDTVIGMVDQQTNSGQRQALFELWTHTNNPYAERMALFLLGVWTVSGDAIDDETFRDVFWTYYKRLQTAAYSDTYLPDLGVAITRDPLMLIYLNNELNVRGSPNENYARELMELFTVGTVNLDGQPNYTETQLDGSGDIAVAARMLTGWRVQYNYQVNQLIPQYVNNRHAPGPHTMFAGTPHQFTGENDEALVRGIFANHPNTKNYYAKEILMEYLTPNPSNELVINFGRIIAENDYKLRPAMSVLLRSKAFYHPLHKDTLPKTSIEFAVETIKMLGLEDAYDSGSVDGQLVNLSMPVNAAPSVFWFNPATWTSASISLERSNFISMVIGDTTAQARPEPDWSPAVIMPAGAVTPRQASAFIAGRLGVDSVPESVYVSLEQYMNRRRQFNGTYQNQPFDNTNAEIQRRKGLGAYYVLMASPSYQLK